MNLSSQSLKRLLACGAQFGLIVVFVLLFAIWRRTETSKRPLKVVAKTEKKAVKREPVEMPFYVFSMSDLPYPKNFAPSGYMGDGQDLMVTGAYDEKLKNDYPSLRVAYYPSGEKGWAGLMWQNPANNWGEFDGGYDLSKANKLTFWAKGEKGGETVEFKIGGINSVFKDSINITSGDIVLTKKWSKYVFPLENYVRGYISGGFCFVVIKEENPDGCVFYLDEVKYES